MEQATGIEPAPKAWEALVLPLNYACKKYKKKWCPEPESNWHAPREAQDFKSCASTCSAIRAAHLIKMVTRRRFELLTP